jgi:hypothetical protein
MLATPGTPRGNIVQQYGLVPMSSAQSKDFLSALAPLEVLCELGKAPRVSAVCPTYPSDTRDCTIDTQSRRA